MTDDKWIYSDKRTKKLIIRFRVRGYSKQFFISTGLKDTVRNRGIVRSKRDAIDTDITLDRFDSSLDSYQFKKRNVKPQKKETINLLELWDKFTEFQETQLEKTTILNRYAYIKRYIDTLPNKSLSSAFLIREFHLKSTTREMTWLLINAYSQCCDWAVSSGLIGENPFVKLKLKKPKKKEKPHKAFTLEQRDLIIRTFELSKYCHYASLVKFLFWTGCRPGEAFALTLDDISNDLRKIQINKSCNLYKIQKTTKNNKSRVFPVSKNSKLHLLLAELKSTNRKQGLVFTTLEGDALTTEFFRKIWKGQKTRKYEYFGVVGELAKQGKVPYLSLYATRHTFATWAITEGSSPDKVALWMGDKVETVLKYYCHPEAIEADCPDF